MGWCRQGSVLFGCPVSLRALCWAVVVMVCCGSASGQPPCSLDDVAVMDGFDSSKFVGRWFEIEWIAPTYQDSGNSWINYYHDYSEDQFGFVTGYYSGKDPNSEQCFLGRVANLNTKDHPAKMLQYSHGRKHSLIDYWVLETDYTTYAIVYCCVERNNDVENTCHRARSWLWGRGKTLPESLKVRARNLFDSLCMNSTLLYVNEFRGDDCELESTGAASALRGNSSAVLLLLLCLLQLNKLITLD